MSEQINMTADMNGTDKAQQQLERLQATLNRACKNVPFHRNRIQEAGLSDITGLEDIENLPFMDRSHLATHYPYGLFAVPLRDIVRIHTAPGSGASPSISGYTKTDLVIWKKMVAKAYAAANVTDRDIILIHLPPGLANWARDYKDGGEALGAGVIPNAPLSVAKTLMVLRDYKVTTLVTTPAFARHLTAHMFERECHPNELNLKQIILVGEPDDGRTISELGDSLHVDVRLNYGLSEIPGPAIAHECRYHDGLHMNDDYILSEIIDPASGRPVPTGEKGELVLTTLSTRAFPLIRFRTGDMAKFLPQACPCGETSTRIQWLAEQADNYMLVSGIRVSQAQIRENLKRALQLPAISCTIKKACRSGADILLISLTMDDDLFSDEIKNLQQLIAYAEETLTEQNGIKVEIRLTQQRV
ncbi:phenylacetate--CoA ligase family protein [Desulfobacter latus]|uniref:Phenylacetate--CoA ligase family protein n=1 Tax=Desulfobacter latus TaxID=2292 RepID=A0A850T9Y9_9BACT|nr:AMP-binding protein [Desulfobacter latus]NWH04186.1 phenylacetate--CoA ligase family protein [Desulfobacter latus]